MSGLFCSVMWRTDSMPQRASNIVTAAVSVLVLQSAHIQPWAVLLFHGDDIGLLTLGSPV